jgi:hypothetical protein
MRLLVSVLLRGVSPRSLLIEELRDKSSQTAVLVQSHCSSALHISQEVHEQTEDQGSLLEWKSRKKPHTHTLTAKWWFERDQRAPSSGPGRCSRRLCLCRCIFPRRGLCLGSCLPRLQKSGKQLKKPARFRAWKSMRAAEPGTYMTKNPFACIPRRGAPYQGSRRTRRGEQSTHGRVA